MFKKLLFNRKNKGNIMAFLSTVIIVSASSMVKSDAASYYIRTVFDEGSFGMISQVISEKTLDEGESLERKDNINYSAILDYRKVHKGGGNDDVPGSSLIANIVQGNKVATQEKEDENSGATSSKVKEIYKAFTSGDAEDGENKGLLFTFPGLRETEQLTYVGMSADAARAELVANTLTKGMNDALAFIQTYSGAAHAGGDGLRHVVAQLARITSQFPDKASSSFNSGSAAGNKGFSVYHVTGKGMTFDGCGSTVGEELIPVNGLRYSDYLVISTKDKATSKIVYGYYPWRMQKGYYDTNKKLKGPLEETVGPEYAAESRKKENAYITWGQLAMQAGVNADIRGTQSVDTARDTMTLIGQGLGADLTGTITSVRSLLNLAPVQELILNMGSRSVTHYYGVMTQDMYNTAKSVYMLILTVSLLALGALIVKMIHQKMISTTNIIAKTSLMEGLQDIIFVAVMLALFPSIFELLLELNYWIVRTFSFSSNYLQAYGISGAKVLGLESLAGFMVSTMFLSIDAYINTTYLVRAIVVSFLFTIAPIMTISYAWGPMQKKLYFSYIRELVGNIFMQSFHAITMCFFAGYNTTNMSAMEAIASTYCFIPITQLFRSLVIGSQGGFSEQLGGKLAGQLTNTATGLHKANVSARQSSELFAKQADNAKALSDAGWKSQAASLTADMIGMGVNGMANSEIGSKAFNAMGNKMSKSSNSAIASAGDKMSKATPGSGVGKVAGVGLQGLANLAGAKIGGNEVQKANETANQSLGELQMKHSMENIGIGLAQTGIGLGVSSYDASGGGMVSAGIGSVERAAGEYGKGSSMAGDGGALMAEAKGTEAATNLAAASLRGTVRDGNKLYGRWVDDRNKTIANRAAQEKTFNERGLDASNSESLDKASNAMGITCQSSKDGLFNEKMPSPIVEMRPHSTNNNNVTAKVELGNLKNANKDNAIIDYLEKYKQFDGNMENPVLLEAQQKAERAGMNMSIGNGTGILGDGTKDKGVVDIVINDISRYGIEVDGNGSTYKATSNLNIGENSYNN